MQLTFFRFSCLVASPCKQEDRSHGNEQKDATDGAGKKDRIAALGDDQGPAEIFLGQRAQDNAKQDGDQLEVHAAEEIGHDAEQQDNIDVVNAVVGGVGARHTEGQNDGRQDFVGDAGNVGIEAGKTVTQDIHENIDHDKAQHDGVQDVPILREQGRAGDHAMEHKGSHQNGRGPVAGDAQSQHGDHGGAAGAVVGGFRGGHALDFTLAEGFGMFGHLLGLVIGHKRGQASAGAGGRADDHADQGTQGDGSPAALVLILRDLILGDGRSAHDLLIFFGIILGFHQYLRDGKQADQRDDQVNARHQLPLPKDKASRSTDGIHADGRHEKADAGADQALEDTLVGNARND